MLLRFLHLKIRQFKLVAADTFSTLLAALWALDFVAGHIEISATRATTLPPRTNFNLQLQRLQLRITSQYIESEAQCFVIDCSEFTNSNCNFARSRARMTRRFGPHGIQNRICDADLVH